MVQRHKRIWFHYQLRDWRGRIRTLLRHCSRRIQDTGRGTVRNLRYHRGKPRSPGYQCSGCSVGFTKRASLALCDTQGMLFLYSTIPPQSPLRPGLSYNASGNPRPQMPHPRSAHACRRQSESFDQRVWYSPPYNDC